ncbi:patatin-like phospholipase family protein [Metallumcola ferriviriculae]|uniref:Patatin-like phospholipase family protein n=1 Tax=Metallumcola ferriviriculae TaxID=3039180 RepID=A0AAU0UPR9_9FIRM|nr:patatin-like phospholipase family protein [Desulfitibacteraceae bacterium MK1]
MSLNKPRVGLALGAGAARGLAHIGVLQVLQEENVPIDLIAGSSIGSVFGAMLACRQDFHRLERLILEIRQKQFIDISVPRMGLLKGNKVEEMLRLLTHNKNFDQLDLPLFVVAVDLVKGEKVIINEGNVAEAVRASIAIPGIFKPVLAGGRVLVDGAVMDRVPIAVTREQGAEIVIAVDVKFGGSERKTQQVNNIFDVILLSLDLLDRELASRFIIEADVLIQPDLSDINPNNFDDAHNGIIRGRAAAKEMLPSIKQLISEPRPVRNNNK